MKKIAVSSFVWLSVFILIFVPGQVFAQESPDNARKVLSRVAPQYPTLARSMNIRGSVKAVVTVAPNGSVKSVEVRGGHPVLADAAQHALRQWKFQAESHETSEIIEIRFAP